MKRLAVLFASTIVLASCQEIPGPSEGLEPVDRVALLEEEAELELLWGPEQFVRTNGEPDVYAVTITNENFDHFTEPFVLHIQNGNPTGEGRVDAGDLEALDRASSATVSLDGTELFGPFHFSQNVASLSAEVLVTDGSELVVTLASKPGSGLTIWIEAQLKEGCATQTEIPVAECEALVALYETTGGEGWSYNTGWLSTDTPCSWYGVSCNGGSVYLLSLSNNQLTGTIPAELGDLGKLRYLYLNSNQLSGAIPPELGNLSSLLQMFLFENQLTGTIPPELGNLGNMWYLYLGDNQLEGTIPAALGSLSSLQRLGLELNQLTGTIPTELGNLSNLIRLYLGDNQLEGTIPAALGNLGNLTSLQLQGNQLSGAIPAELGNLSSLTHLHLRNNQLTGTIPAELGNLKNLTYLYLNSNQLSGTIPPELGNLTGLAHMYLFQNQLTGTIPVELGKLSSLLTLNLHANQLTGAIPAELGSLNNLRFLYLHYNQLTGLVPLQVAILGGSIGSYNYCRFVPGNIVLYMPDTPEYRAADVDGDGFICGLGFTP